MRILFLFTILQASAFSQCFNTTLLPSCSIGFSSSLYKILVYDSAGYAIHGDALKIIQNDSVNSHQSDSSRHISSTLFCIDTSNVTSNYYLKFQLNIICFYSKTHYSEVHQERIRLLSTICDEKNYSVLFILQEYPKELFSNIPAILE